MPFYKPYQTDRLVVEHLAFDGYCGVTEVERLHPQPMAVDLELTIDMASAAAADDLGRTVDYAHVAEDMSAIAGSERFHLIEALAERLANAILSKYPVRELELWVRKLAPPLKPVKGSVGVCITRRAGFVDAPSHVAQELPAEWLLEHTHLLKSGRALDLASGRGRNTLYLAQEGFSVEAWDWDPESLRSLEDKAANLGLKNISTRLVDLEQTKEFPKQAYQVILVFYYLQRNVIPHLIGALAPGGVLLYETFLIDNHERFNHPRRREFCLGRNELLSLFKELRVLAYREGAAHPDHGPFVASLVAERPS